MTVGLPGTGIGGIFYLLLAVCMPVKEFIQTLKGKTNLKRWSFIVLQLFFVFGVITAMWGEVWLLNGILLWTWGTLKINGPVLMASQSFNQTKMLALCSAYMSFISLAFVITMVHALRIFLRWYGPIKQPAKSTTLHSKVINQQYQSIRTGILTTARG